MIRAVFTLFFVGFTLFANAQKFCAYIQATYSPIPRSLTIVVGDSAIVVKDKKGKPQQFKTQIAALNWLSKKGWRLEPLDMGKEGSARSFLMSRENTTEEELRRMFH